MATMRVAQVSRPGGPLELVERPIPDPGPGSVRIKVQACGVCHSDVFTKEGQWPGITFPRVPGHEVVGVIDAVGKDVPERWQPGQRVLRVDGRAGVPALDGPAAPDEQERGGLQ